LGNLIKSISLKFSLTIQEIKTIFFILVVISLGLTLKYAKIKITENSNEKYNFVFFDSLSKSLENQKLALVEDSKIMEKRVDSDQELSDFSGHKLDSNKKNKFFLKEQSINLNTASKEILTKLPGIGPKTAEKIIELRKNRKGFKSVDELLDVKGIGQSKLRAIKNYLYIENKKS
jgi:competence ComEA-like helix-hairpin-helix protein